MLNMWEDLGGPEGKIERLACWDFILADGELAQIMGKGDPAKGKAMLQVMKAEHALDKNGDGVIQNDEFQRLYLPSNILAAEEAVRSGASRAEPGSKEPKEAPQVP